MFNNRRNVIIAIGAAIAVIAALALFRDEPANEHAQAAEPAAQQAEPQAAAPKAQALPDMAMGKADAPVTIIEYSSLSCPHCAVFHMQVLPQLKEKYIDTGKLRYIAREYPLNEPALAGAVLARCVDPDRFFAFTGLLFEKQESWAFKQDANVPLKELAKQAGLSPADVDRCLDDEALQRKILAVRDEGQKKGVNSTPSFFVNGMLFNGAPTFEALAEAMKPYLNGK